MSQQLAHDPTFQGEISREVRKYFPNISERTIDKVNIIFGSAMERDALTRRTAMISADREAHEAAESVWEDARCIA